MNENSRAVIHRAGLLSLQALACIILLPLPASAGDPLHKVLGCPVPDCIGKWCRDDFCPKKEPCAAVSICFGCDDYDAKKPPCVCVPLRFVCDDYCKKCPPKSCRGPLSQFLKCEPSCQPSGCEHFGELPCDDHTAGTTEPQHKSYAEIGSQRPSEPLPAQPQRLPPVIVRASDIQLTK